MRTHTQKTQNKTYNKTFMPWTESVGNFHGFIFVKKKTSALKRKFLLSLLFFAATFLH